VGVDDIKKSYDSFEGFVLTKTNAEFYRVTEEKAQQRRMERAKRLEEMVALLKEGLEEAANVDEDRDAVVSNTSSSTSSSSASSTMATQQTNTTLTTRPSKHAKEEEFVRLLLLMESDSKLSNELFGFLFSLLLDNSVSSSYSSRQLDFLYIFFKVLRKANYDLNLQVKEEGQSPLTN